MPTESETLTAERIRKQKALPGLRELQLRQSTAEIVQEDVEWMFVWPPELLNRCDDAI
jgi:hypothetical protein